ncbi:Protein argonaute 4B [Hordeum vulgare]|nr:Protein argonaute 4B [Hordeum vulgare]
MESQTQCSKGDDSSKSPTPHGGKGDESSKSPMPHGSKGDDPSKSPMPHGGKGDDSSKSPMPHGSKGDDPSKSPMPHGGKGYDPRKAPPMPQMLPITRPTEPGTRGRHITLLTNHFKVSGKPTHGFFYHYHMDLKYEDDKPGVGEGMRRKVMRQLHETYASSLAGKQFAFDGETGLYTAGPLPFTTNVFEVVLVDASSAGIAAMSRSPGGDGSPGPSDSKRMKQETPSKIFKVEITFAAKVPMNISSQDALRVLDIILRQHSAKQNCLLVRQSFFRKDSRYVELGGGVRGCQGFYSSFRPTQSGLSLNVDLTTTMVVRPGPVIDFLLFNQDVKDTSRIDWRKVCLLVPLQRYKKSLSTMQRSKLVEGSRQRPDQRMLSLTGELRANNYNSDPMLRECGISIAPEFTQVEGRVLQAPQLIFADGRELHTPNGRWNFNNDKFIKPIKVETWGVVNFSAQRNVEDLVGCLEMAKCGAVIEERHQMRREPPTKRVEAMFQQIKAKLTRKPDFLFLLCVLPEKNCDIYGPWKRECLVEHGIFTQCLVPPANIKDQYLTNVLLKINAKLGGLNSLLKKETARAIPHVSRMPTIIFGMDVSHGSPGQNLPSVAAVVSSLKWPIMSKYRASVCTQSPKLEMIDALFKPIGDDDHGLIKDSIVDFLKNNDDQRPEQIIIFRDGVSESQFNQALNEELAQIMEACNFFGGKHFNSNWFPKFTLIVAQKNHHTRFFQRNGQRPHQVTNVPPGTVVDRGICHPRNYDFYMCAHAGIILCYLYLGTTRPTHYHVLHDDIGFSADELEELVHSLSYVRYQRSTTAISVVAPIFYAHLAAAQVAKFTRLDDMSEMSSQAEAAPVPELPRLHRNVASTMFFC